MFKITRRENLIPFFLILGLGLAASIMVPPMFSSNILEMPAFVLLPGELALVLILAVLFFENATPAELIRLSLTMLAITMFSGAISNFVGKTSQQLPDSTLILNWVQLIVMNITGLVATVALYQCKAASDRLRAAPAREPARTELPDTDFDTPVNPFPTVPQPAARTELREKADAASGESAAEILAKLDVNRINSLESSLHAAGAAGDAVSLEALFADESNAAKTSSKAIGADDLQGESSLDDLFTKQSSELVMPTLPQPPVEDAGAKPKFFEPPKAGLPQVETIGEKPAGQDKLFDDVSGDIDDIFSNLAPAEAQLEVADALKSATPAAEATAESAGENKGTLFEDVSGDIDDIFSNLAPAEAQLEVADAPKLAAAPEAGTPAGGAEPAPTEPPAEAPSTAAETPEGPVVKEIKEFGRLSGAATAKTELATPGTLKTIGQMLLDTQAIENIIKQSDVPNPPAMTQSGQTAAKVVSVSRGADIQSMLDKLASVPGIDSSLVIGKDGLLIGASQSLGMMKDVYGVLSLGVHSTTNLGTKRVDMGELKQAIMVTGAKATIMTEVGIGVLAVFCDNWDNAQVNSILEAIGKTISESQEAGVVALPTEILSASMLSADAAPQAPAASAAAAPAPSPVSEPAPVAQAEPEPIHIPQPPIAAPAESGGSLLSVSDDEIGDIFDGMMGGSDDVKGAVTQEPPAPSQATAAIPEPQPAAKPAEPPTLVNPGTGSQASGGLLNVSDDEIGDLFDNMMAPGDAAPSAPSQQPPAPEPVAAASAQEAPSATPPAPAAEGTLLSVSDSEIGDIFDNLLEDPSKANVTVGNMDFTPPEKAPAAEPPAQAPAAPAAPAQSAPAASTPAAAAPAPSAPSAPAPSAPAASTTPAEAPKAVKEFGRLSATAAASQQAGQEGGTIKAIGRQLIDVQAVENIIKAGEKRERMGAGLTTARVISAARGEGIRTLLTKIDSFPGVAGSLIVGNDGLVIASTLQTGMDKDLLGALCTAMHSHTELAGKKLEMGKLRQIIFHASDKITVLTAVAVGVLAVFVEERDLARMDQLLNAIESTVRG